MKERPRYGGMLQIKKDSRYSVRSWRYKSLRQIVISLFQCGTHVSAP